MEETKVKNDLVHDSCHWFERMLGFRAQYTKNNGILIYDSLTSLILELVDLTLLFIRPVDNLDKSIAS